MASSLPILDELEDIVVKHGVGTSPQSGGPREQAHLLLDVILHLAAGQKSFVATRGEGCASNPNCEWLHVVIGKDTLLLALGALRQRSDA